MGMLSFRGLSEIFAKLREQGTSSGNRGGRVRFDQLIGVGQCTSYSVDSSSRLSVRRPEEV